MKNRRLIGGAPSSDKLYHNFFSLVISLSCSPHIHTQSHTVHRWALSVMLYQHFDSRWYISSSHSLANDRQLNKKLSVSAESVCVFFFLLVSNANRIERDIDVEMRWRNGKKPWQRPSIQARRRERECEKNFLCVLHIHTHSHTQTQRHTRSQYAQ